jgi:hypothetical protein
MITMSIFWALVLALFASNSEQPLLWKRRRAVSRHKTRSRSDGHDDS